MSNPRPDRSSAAGSLVGSVGFDLLGEQLGCEIKSALSFKEPQSQAPRDIFGDAALKSPDSRHATTELEDLAKIEAGEAIPKEKCAALWKIISGTEAASTPSHREQTQA